MQLAKQCAGPPPPDRRAVETFNGGGASLHTVSDNLLAKRHRASEFNSGGAL